MQRFRIAGLCLVAVFALSAVLAAGASAFVREPPEVGRCVSVKIFKSTHAKYKDAGCKTVAKTAEEEKFEWQPAFEEGNGYNETHPPKLAYKSESKLETSIQLETTGTGNPGKVKSVVTCKNSKESGAGEESEGLVTGPKISTAKKVIFRHCESSGLKCKTTGAAEGEIKVAELDGLLGIEKKGETKAKDKVANEFTPKGGVHFTDFACGGIAVEVKGHVLNPVTANAMKLTATVKFTAKGGKQKPEKFAAESGKCPAECPVLLSKFSNVPGEFEQSGQTLTAIQTNEEKLEISTVE
jgi:hypothetical protein